MSVSIRSSLVNTLILKSSAKVQKIFDICKFLSLRKSTKTHQILCKYNQKPSFVQTHLNERKSIFEVYRIKNVIFCPSS